MVVIRQPKEGMLHILCVMIADIQAADRMSMRMSELVEHVSKKPIPPWTKNLLVEVMVCDEDDEDVEVSSLMRSISAETDDLGSLLFGSHLRCGIRRVKRM